MPCEKDWVDILTALLTPTIAVLGSIIAWLQWQTNRHRLKHELFEKRYEVYCATTAFIVSIVQSSKVEHNGRIKFLGDTKPAKMLFPKKTTEYLDCIHSKACDLGCLIDELDGVGVSPERSENVKKQRELKEWFYSQLTDIDRIFQSYIKLKHW